MRIAARIIALVALAFAGGEAASQSTQSEEVERQSPDRLAPKVLSRPGTAEQAPLVVKEGVTIAAFEMAWEAPPKQEVLRRIAAAASVMLGQDIDQTAAMKGLADAVPTHRLVPGRAWSSRRN